jgi:hypothetical protein
MKDLKLVKPSESYILAVPADAEEEYDGAVSSFWLSGQPLLLQVSAYVRTEGRQPSARQRLQARMDKTPANWKLWNDGLHPDPSVDQATAECMDSNQVVWIHTYLVWPHLALYTLVSGPETSVYGDENWALNALRSIALVVH